ncbi:MAG: response regulator [Bacteroidia bacterium]|nr:response regulator [Bacteroidia bacterium]
MPDTSPSRVLIVDDEPGIVTAIEFLMQQHGFVTETAYHGADALTKIGPFDPQLVILDVSMPRMDGFEVALEIRKQPHFQDISIVFLTARGTESDKLKGYGSGADRYMTKPFDNHELVRIVQDMLERW